MQSAARMTHYSNYCSQVTECQNIVLNIYFKKYKTLLNINIEGKPGKVTFFINTLLKVL